jgi:hypothetical protein
MLDSMAKSENLPTLSEMVSVSAEEFDDMTGDDELLTEDEKNNPPWVMRFLRAFIRVLKLLRLAHSEKWYPAQMGLTTVRFLVTQIRGNPGRFADDGDWLLRDLTDLEGFLKVAQNHQSRFHLSLDI